MSQQREICSVCEKKIGDKIFNQWWNSPGHQQNIMSPNFTIEGIGIYISGTKVMATQNFCGGRR